MKLLIDAGNTRIKWARVDGQEWLSRGTLPVERAAELSSQFANLHDIGEIWVSNVAGDHVAQHIRGLGAGQMRFIAASESQCGVHNGYHNAAQLGSDRWAALIAAWNLVRGKCLVVNCGTATTVDALSGQGEFLGGLILPGVELMQRSLAGATNQLKMSAGKFVPFPLNTADALFSGSIQASCGAIERQQALLGDDSAPVILGGGAAGVLQPYLGAARSVDDLVLRGLLLIAQEANAA
ncbi:MAG: type III pantothenate kinase [Nitrosomonadales bacterium]|nr:type III pantothenate kinase [Nitrosomonadales bacterium]